MIEEDSFLNEVFFYNFITKIYQLIHNLFWYDYDCLMTPQVLVFDSLPFRFEALFRWIWFLSRFINDDMRLYLSMGCGSVKLQKKTYCKHLLNRFSLTGSIWCSSSRDDITVLGRIQTIMQEFAQISSKWSKWRYSASKKENHRIGVCCFTFPWKWSFNP